MKKFNIKLRCSHIINLFKGILLILIRETDLISDLIVAIQLIIIGLDMRSTGWKCHRYSWESTDTLECQIIEKECTRLVYYNGSYNYYYWSCGTWQEYAWPLGLGGLSLLIIWIAIIGQLRVKRKNEQMIDELLNKMNSANKYVTSSDESINKSRKKSKVELMSKNNKVDQPKEEFEKIQQSEQLGQPSSEVKELNGQLSGIHNTTTQQSFNESEEIKKIKRINKLLLLPVVSILAITAGKLSDYVYYARLLENGRSYFIFLEDMPQLIINIIILARYGSSPTILFSIISTCVAIAYVLFVLARQWIQTGSILQKPITAIYYRGSVSSMKGTIQMEMNDQIVTDDRILVIKDAAPANRRLEDIL